MSAAPALHLYEHADALEVVREWVFEHEAEIIAAGGEMPPELAALVEQAEGDFAQKAERVALFIRELLASAKAVKEEVQRLQARQHHYEKAAEGLKGYLKAQLERVDVKKLEGKLVTLRIQANPPAVCTLLDAEQLGVLYREHPDGQRFIEVVPATYRINRDAVVDEWKRTERTLPGIAVDRGSHLRIV